MGIKNVRLLAAVMFTDIVGYTAVMQENEIKANKQRSRHRSVLEKRALEFEGKPLHYYGDGAITIFSSAFNAVMCAIHIQRDLKKYALPLRIGLHMGDIVYNEEEVYGDAVNIASRLEALSTPGGILISEKVKDEIKNNGSIKTTGLGSRELKNVKKPVNIFAVSNEGISVPPPQAANNPAGRIAVLPFVNMSDELGFEYFSDGLTEEIINVLTKETGLDVISRTSAFAYKGHNEDVRSIAGSLSVSHILEGSVRKDQDKIRVTAQLIEAGEGFHLWSETYDHHLKDIFESQDIICEQILDRLTFSSEVAPAKNDKAYEIYMRGIFEWRKQTTPSVKKALNNFKEAINASPNFVDAYINLANCYCYLGIKGQLFPRLAFQKAGGYASEAILRNSSAAEAFGIRGMVRAFKDFDFKNAETAFAKAFSLDENLPQLHHSYATFLNAIGENKLAVKYLERALQKEPLNLMYNTALGQTFFYTGNYAKALEQFDYVLELEPAFLAAIDGKGWVFAAMEERRNAHELFEAYQNLVSQEQKNIPQLIYLTAKMGMKDVAEHFLTILQLGEEKDKYKPTSIDIALIYLGLKKYDEAFFHLQRAIDDRLGQALFIQSNPIWDDIKGDKRYEGLLQQMNLRVGQNPSQLIHFSG